MSWNPVFVMRDLLENISYGNVTPQHFVGSAPLDSDFPYSRITSIAGIHREHMQGPAGSAQKRIQIDWWDKDPDQLNLVTETARIKLSGLRGAVEMKETVFQVRRLHMEEDDVDSEPQKNGDDSPVYHCRQEWRMDYEEEI